MPRKSARIARRISRRRGRAAVGGFDWRTSPDDASCIDLVGGPKTWRPHRRAGADEIVQCRDERNEARTRGGIAMETVENEVVEAGRYGAPVMPRARRRQPNLRVRIVRVALREWEFSGEQFVDRHAKSEHVGRRRDRLAQAFLRRHVAVGAGVTGWARLILKTSSSEVEQHGATVRQYDVRRFDVHMQKAAFMHVLKGSAKVDC